MPDTFNSQFLTPARLRWVLDIGESTEAAWREAKAIQFFRQGRVVRYDPAAVLDFITRNSLKARGSSARTLDFRPETLDSAAWQRLERLIGDQVAAQLGRQAAA